MPLLEARNINISFSGTQILHDVQFEIVAGEINCLCGENGAGKSTLIKVFSGINSNYTGEILVNGKAVRLNKPMDAVKNGIYAVQQHRDLAPTLNAMENIFLNNEIFTGKCRQRYNRARMRELAKKYISKFGVEIDLDCPVSHLTVAEQGIVAICKALARKSQILLIDEASAPLDDKERKHLYESLKGLAAEGKGIVYITHHLDEVFIIGNTITILRDGFNAGKFGVTEISKKQLIANMTGNTKLYSRAEDSNKVKIGAPILKLEQVNSGILENITLELCKGEILGIAGLEGSGMKQIAECCFGIRRLKDGDITIHGNSFRPKSPIQAIVKGIGLVPDDRKVNGLVLCRDISDNIITTHINRQKKTFIGRRFADHTANKYVKRFNIKCTSVHQLVEYLSGGNQQKTLVAKWMNAKTDVLFMIEPTEGIDVGARADLYEIFREMAREGISLIIATGDIDELLELSDRILTMRRGRIIHEYAIDSADKQQILADILLADDTKDGVAV